MSFNSLLHRFKKGDIIIAMNPPINNKERFQVLNVYVTDIQHNMYELKSLDTQAVHSINLFIVHAAFEKINVNYNKLWDNLNV